MLSKLKILASAAAFSLVALSFAPQAEAVSTIKWEQDTVPLGGSFSFDGTTFSGSGITFDQIVGFGFGQNDSPTTLVCDGCLLSFSTGTVSSAPAMGPFGTYSFNSGGTFEMVGAIPAGQPGAPAHPGSPANTVLADGNASGFFFAELTIINVPGGSRFFFTALGTDTKDDALVEYFGLSNMPTPLEWEASTTELGGITGNVGMDGSFSGTLDPTKNDSADFGNSIPEPATTALLLLGAVGVLSSRRRK